MNSWLSFALLVAAVAVVITEARVIPADPVSVMMDSYGNPVVFLREKRTPAGPYPHRAMMFTGYYRPVRKANGQATGVFAQGNAVSGNAYLGDSQQDYLQRGPEPIDETEVSSAEAEAAPNPLEHHVDYDEQNHPPQEQPDQQHDQPESHVVHEEEQEPSVYTTQAPAVPEPEVQQANSPKRPSKKQGPKKTKKPQVVVEDEDYESEEENEDEDDEPAVPFVPFKSNRRQGNMPNLNNFFPMVFSFPRNLARGGSSSSGMTPGMITAIANSYSTSKGGVAHSVATAYGGSPQGKKQRRSQPAQE